MYLKPSQLDLIVGAARAMPRGRSYLTVAIGAAAALLSARLGLGECFDPEHRCSDGCPAELACDQDADCPDGYFCTPFCATYSYCTCSADLTWVCNGDFCTGKCLPIPVPTGPRGYQIVDLGTLGGLSANALAVNEKTQVVGEADSAQGGRHAYLWQNGVMTDIGANPPPPWSSGLDINESTQVVVVNGDGSSLVWANGAAQKIASLQPNGSVRAESIDDLGRVVGTSNGVSFLWDNGQLTDLSNLLRMGVYDLNNVGQFCGAMSLGPNIVHATVWTNGMIQDLGTLGGLYSFATEINDLGEVIGQSERAPGGNRQFWDFLWTDGRMIDLGATAPGKNGIQAGGASGFNNCGEVVGDGGYPDIPFSQTGVLYHPNDGPRDLSELIASDAHWYQLAPNAINDHGEIVGYGLFYTDSGPYGALLRAFLMAPQIGDMDTDGDVDLLDVARMQTWFTGSAPLPAPRCLRADLDRDGDVDLLDLAALEEVMTGPK